MKQRCFISLLFFVSLANGQIQSPSALYNKKETVIAMRDGVKLYTAIYTPKDQTELHAIILQRTPYSCNPYGSDNFPKTLDTNPGLTAEGYIFVFQDVRGRYMSEGRFTEVTPHVPQKNGNAIVDESSDAYDTIDWLLKNVANNNGNVGMKGISYPGFFASAALPNAHPALKAVSPQAPVTDEFEGDDIHHRGAFFLLDNAGFYNFFDAPRTELQKKYLPINSALNGQDAYEFYLKLGPIKNVNDSFLHEKSAIWNEILQHDTYDDYWQRRNIRKHFTNIGPAVFTIGGWFDAEDLFGSLKTFAAIDEQSAATKNYLMMGPWTHGGWARSNASEYATYNFGRNTADVFKASEANFFRHFLLAKGNFDQPKASIFFTGSNEWKTFNSWPVPAATDYNLYLNTGYTLTKKSVKSRLGFDRYDSDPASPVPYTAEKTDDRDNNYMGADQRFLMGRNDVISYTGAILDNDLTLAGPVVARLFVRLNCTDADFVVKIIDVHPDSTQQLVRAEVIRGKFRNSLSKPEPFVPDDITPIKLTLNDIAHTFLAGHKLMVQIQSSWFPLVDRNPQQFMRIPEANASDFRKATINIERNARYMSVIEFKRLN